MERSAKITYRAYVRYVRYKKHNDQRLNQAWQEEFDRINIALDMFKEAGITIDKK